MFSALIKTIFHSLLLVIILLGLITTAFTILGFFGDWHWFVDLTSHFRILYILYCGFAITVLWLFNRQNRLHVIARWLFFAILLINLMQVLKFYIPVTQPTVAKGDSLRVLQSNIWVKNFDVRIVTRYITRTNPDIIALEEYAPYHHYYFQNLKTFKNYPYSLYDPLGKMALYSKYPLCGHVEFAEESANSILSAYVWKNHRKLKMLVAHPDRPNRGEEAAAQQAMTFSRLAELAHQSKVPVILVGDLNSTPWSVMFEKLVHDSGLKDARMGFGVRPTYPAYYPKSTKPFPLALLPIDQILISPKIRVNRYLVGKNVGSDHLPVLVDLEF